MYPLIVDNATAIIELCREFGVVRLEVFGSVCTDAFDPESSDVDFLVEYPPDFDLGPWGARQSELQRRLGALLGRDVELFEGTMLRNKWVRAEAAKTRHLLYQSPDHVSEIAGYSTESDIPTVHSSLHPKSPKWLDDIQAASAFIQEVLDGKALANYEADAELRAVVERKLGIIGVALDGISRVDPATVARLPDVQEYIDVGEHLIRDYYAIDHGRVWELQKRSLASLNLVCNRLVSPSTDVR